MISISIDQFSTVEFIDGHVYILGVSKVLDGAESISTIEKIDLNTPIVIFLEKYHWIPTRNSPFR